MTSTAMGPESEPSAAERGAWEVYRESLNDLAGREYEETERASWEALQHALQEIAAREKTPA